MSIYLLTNILNTKEELVSFPVNQGISLQFSENIEDSQIQSFISIFRMIDDSGLFNFGDTYNQSIGYVREKFDVVDFIFSKTVQLDGTCNVILQPKVPLHPNSNYGLFIDKGLSTEYLAVTKTITKSSSSIDVILDPNSSLSEDFTLTVTSTPLITTANNIISFTITSVSGISNYHIDSKSTKHYVMYNGSKIVFQDTVYVEGEEFQVSILAKKTLEESTYSLIKTAISADISKIATADDSKRFNYNDVVAYYQSNAPIIPPAELPENTYSQNGIMFKYISSDRILVTLPPTILTSDLDLVNMSWTTGEAYEMYTLGMYGLYDPTLTYTVTATIKDAHNLILKVVQGPV